MPRIFKMSKFLLKLYVPNADKIQDLKLFIYTDNYNLAAEISEGIKVEGNIVNVVIQNYAVCNLNDGIINYIAKGNIEGREYIIERQSNYYLKSPSDYTSCDIIDITEKFIDGGEGIMTLKASDFGVDGFGSVKIDATEYGEEKYENGKQEQKDKLESITITENGVYDREDGYYEVIVDISDTNGSYDEGYDMGYQNGYISGEEMGISLGKDFQKDLLESITITENGTYTKEDGYNEVIVNVEGDVCPELEEITITENGTYEGAYNKVNVDVPQEGSSCNLQEKFELYTQTEGLFTILPDEGYDGMSKVDVDIYTPLDIKYNEGLEQGKTEGKNSIINSLQTLNVTENGTYTPPTFSYIRLDGDDKYEVFHPTDNNAFEIKFRLNGDGYREFFSQNGNDINFIGLRVHTDFSELYINWYNKQILINGVDFEKWHTLVVKMSDENARVILDGQVYNDYTEVSSYESNGQYVEIYGNIDLDHFTFWNTWEDYNNGTTPYFNFKVTPEGLMRNYKGGEYSVVNNIGGGSAQYMEENITEGYNEVIVNVKNDFNKVEMSLDEYLSMTEYDNNTIYLLN